MSTPEKPEIRKSFMRHDEIGLVFGTRYTAPYDFLTVPYGTRDGGTLTRDPVRVLEPNVVAGRDVDALDLPEGWAARIGGDSHGDLDVLYAFWLEVKHGLKFKHPRGGRMPEEILWLLSGSMQTGMDWSYRNYQKYRRLEGLKFLPFLITPDHFRFFVFRPTAVQVMTAVATFERVLETLSSFGTSQLPPIASRVLAAVRQDEIRPVARGPCTGEESTGDRCLGFAYRALKGPQDAVRFTYS